MQKYIINTKEKLIMPPSIFALLTTVLFLVIPYILEVSVSYSYIFYAFYGMCSFIISIIIGIKFHRYRSEKQGIQWNKINIPLIFSKTKNENHTEASELQTATTMLTLTVKTLCLVMVWNVVLIFLPIRETLFMEYTFLNAMDNIAYFVQELAFQQSRTSPLFHFAFSDYISMFGLHSILLVWESYFFSSAYNKFLEIKK